MNNVIEIIEILNTLDNKWGNKKLSHDNFCAAISMATQIFEEYSADKGLFKQPSVLLTKHSLRPIIGRIKLALAFSEQDEKILFQKVIDFCYSVESFFYSD